MKMNNIKKPRTPSDVARNEKKPELVISCEGKNKKAQYCGYIVLNFPLKEELDLVGFINMGFTEENGKIYIAIANSGVFESEVYKLTDLETTIINNDLFNEIAQLCKLDFEKAATYHFFDISYDSDGYGNIIAFINTSKYYTTPYKLIPYSHELTDEWRYIYEPPTNI